MKKTAKPVFFIVLLFIVTLVYTAFYGVKTQYGDIEKTYVKGASDIRFGIDIKGGVEVTFAPQGDADATDEQLDSVEQVLKMRLVSLNITDYDIYKDTNKDRIMVSFPWKADEASFDPETAIKELGETALLTFREGYETDTYGKPAGVTAENIILQGMDVVSAKPGGYEQNGAYKWVISLELSPEGTKKFAQATTKLAGNGVISIWMDDTMISYPYVENAITDGKAQITGNFTYEQAKILADKINSGALPFSIYAESYNTIDPSLGQNALEAMVIAGLIAFVLVGGFMIIIYRLPGAMAAIALAGQLAATIAVISGYFGVYSGFTLTLPGIAGIILAIGMGVDANVITAERIKEELKTGKTLDGAITSGFKMGLKPIIDGNVTVIIVAVVLMGAFGVSDSFFAKMFYPVFFLFGKSTEGVIYSFGFTLLVGVILNFIFGIIGTRLLIRGISQFKAFRNKKLYGGENNG